MFCHRLKVVSGFAFLVSGFLVSSFWLLVLTLF